MISDGKFTNLNFENINSADQDRKSLTETIKPIIRAVARLAQVITPSTKTSDKNDTKSMEKNMTGEHLSAQDIFDHAGEYLPASNNAHGRRLRVREDLNDKTFGMFLLRQFVRLHQVFERRINPPKSDNNNNTKRNLVRNYRYSKQDPNGTNVPRSEWKPPGPFVSWHDFAKQ